MGKPTAVWWYRDRQGRRLGCIRRFDPPDKRKQFLPLTPAEKNGRTIWKPESFDTPRPLFGLDRLAVRPDAPILVVEGEKAAVGLDGNGGAAALVPSHLAITSPGGAKAAAKADWTPLRGRDVVAWPDADEAGAGYAKDVAELTRKAGARSVRIVETSGLPDGFDLADPLPDGLDVEARIAAAQEPPSYTSFDQFTMVERGLHVEVRRRNGSENIWVSAAFEVLGRVRDPYGSGWAKLIRYRDPDGRVHEHVVPESALHGELGVFAGELAACGLSISPKGRTHLAIYLSRVDVEARITHLNRTGWHTVDGGPCFALPGEVIGGPSSERVILKNAPSGIYERRGTLDEWRNGVGSLVSGHARAVLAVSAAFAGPLLHLINVEGGGLHLVGASSTGKTTLLRAAASVWGRGASDPGYIRSWRATANAQEGAAALHTDTLFAVDEIGVAEAKDAAAAIYQLSAGVGKGRMSRGGTLRQSQTWRALPLSTGEVPIATKIAEERGRRAHAGQEVRMLDIPADAECGSGVFDHPGPDNDPSKLAQAIRRAATTAYGVAGPEFIRGILADGPDEVQELVREMIDDFVAAYLPVNADGQVKRAAERLGLIGVAGELATEWGIVPWAKGEALAAAGRALAAWIAFRGGISAAEEREAIARIRRFIEAHGEARFENLDEDIDNSADQAGPRVFNRAGFRKGYGADRRWFVLPETWKDEICTGLDPTATARVLASQGMLIRDEIGKKFVRSERTPYGPKRLYVLTSEILDGGQDDA